MELTPQQLTLIGDTGPAAPTPTSGRALKQLANLPLNIVEGLGQGVLSLGSAEGFKPQMTDANFFDITPAHTTSDKAVDFVLGKGGLADVLGESIIPMGAVGKLGLAAGMTEGPLLESAKFAAGFAAPEAGRRDGTGAEVAAAATLGAAQGPLGFLPMKQRLFGSAAIALAHGGYEAATHDATTGTVAGIVDFATGLIPAHVRPPERVAPLQSETKSILPTFPVEGVPTEMRPSAEIYGRELNTYDVFGGAPRPAAELGAPLGPEVDAYLQAMEGTQGIGEGQPPHIQRAMSDTQESAARMANLGATLEGPALPVMEAPTFVGPKRMRKAKAAPVENPNARLPGESFEDYAARVAPKEIPPVEPATPEVATLQTPSIDDLKVAAQEAGHRWNMMKNATTDYPPAVRKAVKKDMIAKMDAADAAWEAAYGSRLTGRNERGQKYSEWWFDMEPQEPKVEAPVATLQKLSPEELAYRQALTERHSKLSAADLKETISDLDNEIANTLDETSRQDYRRSREVAQEVLAARGEASKPATVVASTVVEGAKPVAIKRNGRVGIRAEVGEPTTGTVQSFTKTEAVIALDEGGTVVVPRKQLFVGGVPEKRVATLQSKLDEEALFVRDGIAESGVESVPVSEVDRAASQTGRKPVRGGEADGGPLRMKATGLEVTSKPKTYVEQVLHPQVKAAAEKIWKAINKVVNPNFKSVWANLVDAHAQFTQGLIEHDINTLWERTKDWPTMNAQERARAIAWHAHTAAHEASHGVLDWIRVTDSKAYAGLEKSFRQLSVDDRIAMLQDFHELIGNNRLRMEYGAGEENAMRHGYGKDQWHTPDEMKMEYVRTMGLAEFFSDVMGAHIVGKFKESMLPPEMLPVWKQIKDFFKNMMEHILELFHGQGNLSDVAGPMYRFKEIVEDTLQRFHEVDGKEFRRAMQQGQDLRVNDYARGFKAAKGTKNKPSTFRVEEDIALEDTDYSGFVPPVEEVEPWDMPFYIRMKAAGGSGSTKTRGWGGFAMSQLVQEFGGAIAGSIVGGYAGPDITDGQVSVAEGILIGGILGAMGPRAIRAILAMPKSTTSTFHHRSFSESLVDLFRGKGLEVAAEDATGHGSSVAKFMRFMERNMNLHLPQEIYNKLIDAQGPAAWALHVTEEAFRKGSKFKDTPAFRIETEKFLGGGHVNDYAIFLAGLDHEAQAAGNLYITARDSIATLQEGIIAGLPEGSYKQMMIESLKKGDYLTRQYRLFTDPKFKTSADQIEIVAQWFSVKNPKINLSDSRQIVEDYFHQRKIEGASYKGATTDVGKKLDAAIFQKRDRLDPVFRDALGEYTDPKERVLGTIMHLYQSAVSGRLLDSFSTMSIDGLGVAFTTEQHSALMDGLQAALKGATDPKMIATLQKRLETLQFYVPLGSDSKFGKLSGKMVSRFVRDQLATFDSPWGLLDGDLMRGLAKFHNQVKLGRTALNPMTVMRNMMAVPVMLALGRANPLTGIPRAINALRNDRALIKEMIIEGVIGVDQVKGEFQQKLDLVRLLNTDSTILGLVKQGVNKALDFYRWPDMVQRAAVYMSAKTRIAKKMGLAESHVDVIAAARDFTNRYTVNYTNVSPLVKSLRQVPFTNLFISFTAEMTRIAKNLVEDVFKHKDIDQRLYSLMAIGGLATIPISLEKFATSQLSPKDQQAWDRTRSLMPDYQKYRNLIPIGRDASGRFRYFDMTWLVQIDDLEQMMRAASNGDVSGMLKLNPVTKWDNTPAMNILAEQITGTDLRTKRPIDKNLLTRAQAVIKEILPPILPGGYEFKRITDAFTPTEEGGTGITNARTGRQVTPDEIVKSYLTGLRFSSVVPEKLQQFAISDAKRQLANEAAYLRDVIATNATNAAKQKAVQRFRKAQENILLDLTNKLRPD